VFAYALEGDAARELWHKPIVLPSGHALAEAWDADANARAEGLALLGERIFIVKQSAPVALIELSIDGDRLVAGPAWTLSDLDDASEVAARGPDLYVVGARSESLCRLAPPGQGSHDALACARTWRLPERLGKGAPRWEGLAFLPDGRVVVGADAKKTDRPNAALLPPL
jgi:hypothetical protein